MCNTRPLFHRKHLDNDENLTAVLKTQLPKNTPPASSRHLVTQIPMDRRAFIEYTYGKGWKIFARRNPRDF